MSLLFPSVNVFSSPEEVWAVAFHELGQRIKRQFLRQEPYHHTLAYVRGLMSEVSRKNGWQVADTNSLSVWQNNRLMGGTWASAYPLWLLRIQRAYQLMNNTTEVPHRRSQHDGEG